ncbi:unnamed protein product [Vitrella brassicaformis CCMP3155]|uniref:Uncharacterized protein n=1 Tax=Vitrella brassicaformis (strain CCMP3155) TaxID=1169540 RepID=A0A0G4G8G7_VITBC|nr:unnamed protein product [Vitrella brassicaformis CCMP3155]|eukprot:CEM24644.1 unnamed protein product [Vitrella brassicaformis CCMP3155]
MASDEQQQQGVQALINAALQQHVQPQDEKRRIKRVVDFTGKYSPVQRQGATMDNWRKKSDRAVLAVQGLQPRDKYFALMRALEGNANGVFFQEQARVPLPGNPPAQDIQGLAANDAYFDNVVNRVLEKLTEQYGISDSFALAQEAIVKEPRQLLEKHPNASMQELVSILKKSIAAAERLNRYTQRQKADMIIGLLPEAM